MEDGEFRLFGFGKEVWLALVLGIVLGLLAAPAISPLFSGKQQKGDVIQKIAHLTSGASESELTLSVTLENVRESKTRFRIVLTAPSSLVKIDPTNVTSDPMAPSETREYYFTVTAPRAASGAYKLIINALSVENGVEQPAQTEEAWFRKEGVRLKWPEDSGQAQSQ
ncbi:hypothetical protein COT29_00305 [Candidatus Micrarchaeota archaeon CG08_land_8_20_14_0_20_59_11]|nr:MAG: hypothetical protein COT29_00305 [Candidatus Micrarchaeota archaeon CG08_land_8_20_14_0_20_59_11]